MDESTTKSSKGVDESHDSTTSITSPATQPETKSNTLIPPMSFALHYFASNKTENVIVHMPFVFYKSPESTVHIFANEQDAKEHHQSKIVASCAKTRTKAVEKFVDVFIRPQSYESQNFQSYVLTREWIDSAKARKLSKKRKNVDDVTTLKFRYMHMAGSNPDDVGKILGPHVMEYLVRGCSDAELKTTLILLTIREVDREIAAGVKLIPTALSLHWKYKVKDESKFYPHIEYLPEGFRKLIIAYDNNKVTNSRDGVTKDEMLIMIEKHEYMQNWLEENYPLYDFETVQPNITQHPMKGI